MKGTYPETENFKVKDTIGVPHPYCITPAHVSGAADRFSGILGEDAIVDAEKRGVSCGVRGCQLTFAEHEQALLVECMVDIKEHKEELREYIMSIKDECEANGYAGFAFLDGRPK